MRVWVYKCNRDESEDRACGDWDVVFRRKTEIDWGGSASTTNPVSKHILNESLRPGDLILAYQTNDLAILGVCRVTRVEGDINDRVLWLIRLRRFRIPVPIHELKSRSAVLRRMRAFARGSQGMLHPVSPQEQKELEKACGIRLPANHTESALPPNDRLTGAGFGDLIENRKTELAAVRAVKRRYRSHGWNVTSVEADNCGYDLLCERNGVIECVEVKGIGGSSPAFIITASELAQAERNHQFTICIVTRATSKVPKIERLRGREFRSRYDFRPLQYHATPRRR